jgi:trehalose 6-phosphate synthase/phosphatase
LSCGGLQAQRKGPTEPLLATLTEICGDLHNTVFVITGKDKSFLQTTFGRVPNLGLAAEHG